MWKQAVRLGVNALVLMAVLFAGIYHTEIKNFFVEKPSQKATESKLDKFVIADGEFFIFASDIIPGVTVTENKGFFCHTFLDQGHGEFFNSFDRSISAIQTAGLKQGANAMINMKLSSATLSMQGSRWNSAYVSICGDFVRIE